MQNTHLWRLYIEAVKELICHPYKKPCLTSFVQSQNLKSWCNSLTHYLKPKCRIRKYLEVLMSHFVIKVYVLTTWAAKLTFILEYDVNHMWLHVSFGHSLTPGVSVLVSYRNRLSMCFHDIWRPFFYNESC